jgi:hypothetical protein
MCRHATGGQEMRAVTQFEGSPGQWRDEMNILPVF